MLKPDCIITTSELFEKFKDWHYFGFPNSARMLYELEMMTARLVQIHAIAEFMDGIGEGGEAVRRIRELSDIYTTKEVSEPQGQDT
jgi:hypothetical protein